MELFADDGGLGGVPSGAVYALVGLGGGGGESYGGEGEEGVQGSEGSLLVLFVSLTAIFGLGMGCELTGSLKTLCVWEKSGPASACEGGVIGLKAWRNLRAEE